MLEDGSAGAGLAEDDPVVEAFVSFLTEDLRREPDRVAPLSTSRIERAAELTADN